MRQAILRRMPRQFLFELPDFKERQVILQKILKATPLADDCSLHALAQVTEGFSGADLLELCRAAVQRAGGEAPLAMADFLAAKQTVVPLFGAPRAKRAS